jgi:hypothetical protein
MTAGFSPLFWMVRMLAELESVPVITSHLPPMGVFIDDVACALNWLTHENSAKRESAECRGLHLSETVVVYSVGEVPLGFTGAPLVCSDEERGHLFVDAFPNEHRDYPWLNAFGPSRQHRQAKLCSTQANQPSQRADWHGVGKRNTRMPTDG